MKNDMNLNIRFPRDTWRNYLLYMDNYSEFCRDAILDKINKINSKEYIDSQIVFHEQKIKELKERKKLKTVDQDKINDILGFHAPNYKKNAMVRSEKQRLDFLKRAVQPNLKKLGFSGTLEELDQKLLNWEG